MAAASTPGTVENGVAGSGTPPGRAATTVMAAAAAVAATEAVMEAVMAPATAAIMAEGAAAAVAAGTERSCHLANGILVVILCRVFLSFLLSPFFSDFCQYILVVIGTYCNGCSPSTDFDYLIRILPFCVFNIIRFLFSGCHSCKCRRFVCI